MSFIKLKISTPNNTTYPEIILRKFFNMIFISDDGKKLNIYTATVFGGINDKKNKDKNENLIASYNKDTQDMSCVLEFEYESDIIPNGELTFSDKTDSLWKQADCMRQVWGLCEKIDTQEKAHLRFQEVYPDTNGQVTFDMSENGPIYHIHEDDKKSHECIVARGKFEGFGSEQKYKLLSDHNMEHDGMEFMNWVKAEINLSTSILGKDINYEVELGDAEKYYTPDFTWYFAPPLGYSVDEDSAKVKIGPKKIIRNLVQSVADDTTVLFTEWEENEEIEGRKKARVYISSLINEDPYILNKGKGMTVSVKIDNPRQIGNKQFLLGLLIGFILSFCSDKTRINDYHDCTQRICQCGDMCLCGQMNNFFCFLFPLLAVTTYLSTIFRIEQCVSEKKKNKRTFFRLTKIISSILAIFVFFYVFFAWLVLPVLMQNIIPSCLVNNIIIFSLSGVAILFNCIYIVYCIIHRKKRIYDFL